MERKQVSLHLSHTNAEIWAIICNRNHDTDWRSTEAQHSACMFHWTSICTLPGLHSATPLPTTCTEQVVASNRFPLQTRHPEEPQHLLWERQAKRRYFWRSGSYSKEKCFPWLVKVAQTESSNRLKKPAFQFPVPLLFLIGTLMRALGVDPLPGGRFMPRLSHSPCKTKITRQAEFHWLVIQQPTMMDWVTAASWQLKCVVTVSFCQHNTMDLLIPGFSQCSPLPSAQNFLKFIFQQAAKW